MSDAQVERELKRKRLAKIYADLVKSGNLFPTRKDLSEKGITKDTYRHHFTTIAKLRAAAKALFPTYFRGSVNPEEYVSDEYLEALNEYISSHKRFFITTAVSGQKLNSDFYLSIKKFCKLNKAALLILPSHDPAHNLDNEIDWYFSPKVVSEKMVFEETRLNTNLFISGIRVTAKQINPVTGLSQLSQTKGTFIFASPKQALEYDSVSANKLPHARMTTGAITFPNYSSERGNSQRTAYIAEFQHVMGGIIVEIQDGDIYHFRQVQAAKDGSFCDLGIEYSGSKTRRVSPIFVCPDLHAGEHDSIVVDSWISLMNKVQASEVILHDLFNGASISHWTENNIMEKANQAPRGLNSFESELRTTGELIEHIFTQSKFVRRGKVVKSNHDDFIDRWLQRGGFMRDPLNFKLGCQLAAEVVGTNKDYLQEGLALVGYDKFSKPLHFMGVDEDYEIGGVNLSAHGDRGPNGSRGSIKSLAKAYPKCVIGHSHTPGIYQGAFQVGTSTKLRLGYNRGPSSWVHCAGLVYPNGQRQLINSINGKCHL